MIYNEKRKTCLTYSLRKTNAIIIYNEYFVINVFASKIIKSKKTKTKKYKI
jgi:hypothetical protein